MTDRIDKLQRKLGYQFRDQDLLHTALTHRSVSKLNNERLEFLGDAILGLIIAEELFARHRKMPEGDLSRMRANLVKGETLAEIAREFQLGEYLHLGIGELKAGGFNRDSILADSFEAVLGAMYLDSNYQTCKERVIDWYQARLDDPTLHIKRKDPKSILQEYLQAKQLPLPDYEIVEVHGEPHDQTFVVECRVKGIAHRTKDSDTTRRGAEQKAATAFLAWLEQENE
ncbi:MAG: ribonuclease III [Coxiellaceae bacterium]|nr:ribonuclease III [Coxiellaceae bacterium]